MRFLKLISTILIILSITGCSSLWSVSGETRSGVSSSLVDYLYPQLARTEWKPGSGGGAFGLCFLLALTGLSACRVLRVHRAVSWRPDRVRRRRSEPDHASVRWR